MVEAVATTGYERASVKQVIALAGVSRRSFYELFANKQECFLATFDALAGREIKAIREAYVRSPGGLESRLGAALDRCARTTCRDPKAALLLLVHAQAAGPEGTVRLRRGAGACEELLCTAFASSRSADTLPAPVARGISGGLHWALASGLLSGTALRERALAREMRRWTFSFRTDPADEVSARLSSLLRERVREASCAAASRPPGVTGRPEGERALLLEAMLRLAARHDHRLLTAPYVAETAGLPMDGFFEHFQTVEDCHRAALADAGERLLASASAPGLDGPDWPLALRQALAGLLAHLVAEPLQARALAHDAQSSGEELGRVIALSETLTERLLPRAQGAEAGIVRVCLAGAIWHALRCQVLDGRIGLLAALSDQLAYVALAPLLGADAAVTLLEEAASG
jgi:AcrR family transcriptional regulator